MNCATGRGLLKLSRVVAISMGVPLACGDDTSPTNDESSDTGGSTTVADESTSVDPATTASTSLTSADSSDSGSESTAAATIGPDTSSGDASSSSSDEASTAGPASSSESGTPLVECPAGELGPDIPETLFGNSFGQTDEHSGSCGGEGSPDVGFTFTAPSAGSYTFDTHGSQLDSVIYVLDGTCSGTELGCNDDGDGAQSVVEVELAADQTVTVVVDGKDELGQPFSLRVQEGALGCPDGDIGSTVPQLVEGDSSNAFNGSMGSCGGSGNDVSYLFTAPNTGTFTFDTFGSSFVSRIYIRGAECGGPELGCGREGVLADLVAGQQVTVTVDSPFAGGEFALNIDTLGGACPDDDLGNTLPQTLSDTTLGGDNTLAGSCGGDFSADTTYEFSAPQDGLYQFDTFGSALDTVLYLRDAACDGDELDCNDDFTPNDQDSRIIAGMVGGQTVLVAVDGNGVGAYDLNIDLVPCPDATIVGGLPQDLANSTEGGINKLQPSCGNTPASLTPDYSYAFTAPAAGTYTFDTIGTFYDTVLYVLDGAACNGDEIACNDDYQFNSSSALSIVLDEDQTVTVVVDADFQQEGDFTLHVGALDGECPDEDLGSTVPNSVDGSVVGADNASAGSCGGLTGDDYSYLFTAPEDAFYTFELTSFDFSPIVYARAPSCGGEELTCTNPGFFGGTPLAVANLAAGETVVVTVDSEDDVGDFTMEIDQIGGDGDCCIEHAYPGCGNPEVEDCVCGMDSFCCDNQWDSLCQGEAVDACDADC